MPPTHTHTHTVLQVVSAPFSSLYVSLRDRWLVTRLTVFSCVWTICAAIFSITVTNRQSRFLTESVGSSYYAALFAVVAGTISLAKLLLFGLVLVRRRPQVAPTGAKIPMNGPKNKPPPKQPTARERRVVLIGIVLSILGLSAGLVALNKSASVVSVLDCTKTTSIALWKYAGSPVFVDSVKGICPDSVLQTLESIGDWDLTGFADTKLFLGTASSSLTTIRNVLLPDGVSFTDFGFGALTSIGGKLELQSQPKLTSITFGSLLSLGSDLKLFNCQISNFTLGQLVSIGGNLFLSSCGITEIHFGSLRHIQGDLNLEVNRLASINFGSIGTIGGNVQLCGNVLTEVNFASSLTSGVRSSCKAMHFPSSAFQQHWTLLAM